MDRASVAGRQWKRERSELDVLPMVVIGRLKEATQLVLSNHLEPLFAEHGLNRGDFDVLATLRRAGPPYALSPTALYDATMVTSGAMTGRVDRLARLDLIERTKDRADGRARLVRLTKTGFALIDPLMTKHVANEARVLAGLSRAEKKHLSELLGKLIATLPEPYTGEASN